MRKFKTESKKLLDLMINSIYTNREIFLRELISNASDAVDKLYFKSLTDSSIQLTKDQLGIDVAFDKDARTITVSDNGIGMTQEELDAQPGHHRPFRFHGLQAAENAEQQGDDVDIIGQFGVGFYSAFMVAQVRARGVEGLRQRRGLGLGMRRRRGLHHRGGPARGQRHRHHPDPEGQAPTRRTTTQFLSEYGLKDLIKRYSNYVRYPVRMEVTKTRQKPKPEDAGDDYKPEYEQYTEVETINSMMPIWKQQQVRRTAGGVQRVLQADLPRLRPTRLRTISIHAEGALSLRRAAVHPRPRAVRPVQQGLQEGPGAVQLQRADHGEVRGPAARLLQLRPRRRGQPGPHAQHLA